ncbi:hypothetical protein RIR_jg4535.t1 [Rhizophagus irregularis DAOM 181602=DAOM 197198]|nr:hypothetical protein RIR_jg4535.t1 [Rhizophagus irregularis DAOM 181602=DAOM 197198]
MSGILASLNSIASKLSEIEKLRNNTIITFVKFHLNSHRTIILQNDMFQRHAVVQRSDFDRPMIQLQLQVLLQDLLLVPKIREYHFCNPGTIFGLGGA